MNSPNLIVTLTVMALLIVAATSAGCATNTTPTPTPIPATQSTVGNNTTFSSAAGFNITFPKNLAIDRNGTENASSPVRVYIYLSPNETANGVVVGTEGLTSGKTLNNFTDAQIANLQNYNSSGVYKNLTMLNATNSTLSGKPAHTIVFSGVFPVQYSTTTATNKSLKIIQTFVVNDNTGYVISYKAIQSDYNKYLTLAEQVINSFTLTTKTPTTLISVNATSLGSSSTLSSSYGTPTAAVTGNKFVTYAVYIQNNNAKDEGIGNPNYLKLRDTNGNIYSYDSFTYSLQQQVNGVTLKGLTSQSNTQPGDKYSGLIAFQIPTSATPKSLTYDDYTNKITINL